LTMWFRDGYDKAYVLVLAVKMGQTLITEHV